MSIEKKHQHPIATMAKPTREQMQEALVTSAYRCREDAGECERYLGSKVPDIEFDEVVPPEDLAATAKHCASSANQLRAKEDTDLGRAAVAEVASFFVAAAFHFASADAHLNGHFGYEPIVADHVGDDDLARLHDDERRFATRATKLGRNLTHRGLSKLAEIWPDAYDVDPEALHGDHE